MVNPWRNIKLMVLTMLLECLQHQNLLKAVPFILEACPSMHMGLSRSLRCLDQSSKGGVQVRDYRQQGYCFGFVEFLSVSYMNDSIQASPITIGDRQAVVVSKFFN